MRDQEKPRRSPSWRTQGKRKTKQKHSPSTHRVEPRIIRARNSMRDRDLNERPGEAHLQSKVENQGETKTKQKRSPSTHTVEPWKVLSIRVKSSMRDQDVNERPGEAPSAVQAGEPRGNKNKTKTQSKHPQSRTVEGILN